MFLGDVDDALSSSRPLADIATVTRRDLSSEGLAEFFADANTAVELRTIVPGGRTRDPGLSRTSRSFALCRALLTSPGDARSGDLLSLPEDGDLDIVEGLRLGDACDSILDARRSLRNLTFGCSAALMSDHIRSVEL